MFLLDMPKSVPEEYESKLIHVSPTLSVFHGGNLMQRREELDVASVRLRAKSLADILMFFNGSPHMHKLLFAGAVSKRCILYIHPLIRNRYDLPKAPRWKRRATLILRVHRRVP